MKKFLLLISVFFFSYSGIIFGSEETNVVQSAEPTTFAPISYDKGLNVSTTDGGTRIRFNSLLKFRYLYLFDDSAGVPDTSTFQVPAARMSFSGNAFKPEYKYGVQFEFAQGDTRLLDFYTEYDYQSYFKVRVGQFKVPFSRQSLADVGNLLFTERSVANDQFTLGR